MTFCNSVFTSMLPNVIQFLENEPFFGVDDASLAIWKANCELSWDQLSSTYLSPSEAEQSKHVLSTLLDSYSDLARLMAAKKYESSASWTTEQREDCVLQLLSAVQTEQRTQQWYLDAANLLTASQFHTILRPGLTRGRLVVEKASGAVDTSNRVTVSPTKYLNPFTWGIRFEPLVRDIYQALTQTKVRDMGRLRHRSEPHLAASPDGLVIEGPPHRYGRFVEFKAPVSRPILNKIPAEYMTQMQIQMEVGDVEECDYLEVKFNSSYSSKVEILPQPIETTDHKVFYGKLFLIEKPHMDTVTYRYAYGPLNTLEWNPPLEKDEFILEEIPWWTDTWYLTTVGRSRVWFDSVKPVMESFWKDVQLAKEGAFVLPTSTRKPRTVSCKIIEEDAVENTNEPGNEPGNQT